MRIVLPCLLLLAAAGAAAADEPPAAPQPNTVVRFVHPEKFVDASDQGFARPASPHVLAAIRTQLEQLGRKRLAPGETLTIDVTDIDLAGTYEPRMRSAEWIRVMRDADWPRMRLHYRLERDGAVEKEGDARLADMNYLDRQSLRQGSDRFYYEKRMLAEWFTRTFGGTS